MLLLLLFAVVAGAGTAISPCALPVLPALLSAGATGGRRRPLGVVVGLSVTFAVTIIGLAKVAKGVGVGDGTLRTIAIVVLLAFGLVIALPAVSQHLGGGGVAGFLADPTGSLERSHAVSSRLVGLRGRPRFQTPASARGLPVLGTAPEFTGTQRWFKSRPLTMAGLRGRVVL